MSIINNILSILEQKKISQSTLCSYLNIGTSTMANWKTRNTDPPAKYIIPICEFLNVDPYLVLTGKEQPTGSTGADEPEQHLIELYELLCDMDKGILIGRAELLAEQAEERAREQAKRQELRRSVSEDAAPCESVEVPFVDLPVSAGLGVDLLAQDGTQDMINVPATPTTRRADFSVRVEGDSMEPMFSDGDIVLVEQDQEVPEGQVGIFVVNGAGYIKKAGRRRLISVNDKYDDILIGPDDSVRCFGLVIGKL